MTLCDVCVRLFSCKPDYCIIVSPLDKPRCFWGKQLLICLNKKKLKKKLKKETTEFSVANTKHTGMGDERQQEEFVNGAN